MSNQPGDNFEVYYAEKIWEMIPEIYRREDGLAEPPDVLRAIVEILAKQAAVLRRSQDHLWEDQFIEWCQDWAVPYLGDLVSTRLISDQNLRGRRVDVAKTIYYRRRKGTLRVLEELASDIAGWEGKVVEEFRSLARLRHGLDPKPQPYAGRFSGTLPGGWADIRQPMATELTGSAFDDFYYTPDMRQHRGYTGRKNIPKLAFHLYRLPSRKLVEVNPYQRSDEISFTFDPSGRDIALFGIRQRQSIQTPLQQERDWDEWQSAQIWELPAPVKRHVLGHAEYQIEDDLIAQVEGMVNPPNTPPKIPTIGDELYSLEGQRFISEERLYLALKQLPHGANLLALTNWPEIWRTIVRESLIDDCGKNRLIPEAIEIKATYAKVPTPQDLTTEEITAAGLTDWSASPPVPPEAKCVIDPECGRLKFVGAAKPKDVLVTYHYGFSGSIGAGAYERQSSLIAPSVRLKGGGNKLTSGVLADKQIIQIDDSLTYAPVARPADFMSLAIQSANQQRPYLRLGIDWTFKAKGEGAQLTLEGLWVGSFTRKAIKLQGHFESVTIRHCTLDPGGKNTNGRKIPAVPLVVEGQIDHLIIDSSITGPIYTQKPGGAAATEGAVESLEIRDTILQSLDPPTPALKLKTGDADIRRSTILGSAYLHRLWASEVLVAGMAEVVDTQTGCFRFGAALTGSRLPHAYESSYLTETKALFTSTDFGHWGYAQLAETAAEAVKCGGEKGSEMGAFSACLNPIKMQNLQTKVEEYMPFGLIPIFIREV